MLVRTILIAGMTAALIPSAAPAAPATTPRTIVAQPVPSLPTESPGQLADRCAALEVQLGRLIGKPANAAAAGKANALRAEGDAQCKTGDRNGGITSLRQAVTDLGATPRA